MAKNNKDNKNMTVSEAGRMGGEKTSETHDKEFYQEIGHKGGEMGGQKGGETTAEKYGE